MSHREPTPNLKAELDRDEQAAADALASGKATVVRVGDRDIVVQDLAAYEAMLDRMDVMEAALACARGHNSKHPGIPADEAFGQLLEKYGTDADRRKSA